MHWLTDPFAHAFMVRAILAGMLVGGLCATLGVFVVQRGLSFLGDGLAHATFGGIALGLLLGVGSDHVTWVALPFTVTVALGIGWMLRRGGMRGDVATGVLFAVSFALGVLFLGLRSPTAPSVNVEGMLFGSILAISENDLMVIAGVSLATALAIGVTWTRLAYATFDPELAALSGVPVKRLDAMLLALTAVVIVVAVKTVGVGLVSSFVVIPAAAARLLGRTMGQVALWAAGIGVVGAAVGLVVSYHLNVASGATIILTLATVFCGALVARRR